jgi:hypothetical protein
MNKDKEKRMEKHIEYSHFINPMAIALTAQHPSWPYKVQDWLIRNSGKLLIIVGIAGHILNYNFDRIAGRNTIDYSWGWVQWVIGFGGSTVLILWGLGLVVRRAYSNWDKDVKDVE